MLSAVTVYHPADAPYFCLQARSFARYAPTNLFERILVIENPGPMKASSRQYVDEDTHARRDAILSAYGDLSHSVEFHTASECGRFPHMTGWRSQQILKLAASKLISTERYVAFDAKNHFVFPLSSDFFVTEDGRAYVSLENYRNNPLRVYLESTIKFFGVDPESHLDSFPQPVTTFVFVTRRVIEMMNYVEQRERRPFADIFLSANLAEFFTYSAYLTFVTGSIESHYVYRPSRSRVIWARSEGEESVKAILEETERLQLPVFAIHRRALVKMPRASMDLIGGFWARRGLFRDEAAAVGFLVAQARIERRHHLLKKIRRMKMRMKGLARRAGLGAADKRAPRETRTALYGGQADR